MTAIRPISDLQFGVANTRDRLDSSSRTGASNHEIDPICFSSYLYRDRNLVERFFNKIEQCRRVTTRYDKLAANYLAFIKLAAIRIWLRAYKPRPTALRTAPGRAGRTARR